MLNSWPQRERIVLAASRSLMGKGIRNDKEKISNHRAQDTLLRDAGD